MILCYWLPQIMLCGASYPRARRMQQIFVSFNASKSKCVVCVSRRKSKELDFVRDVKFTINGSDIESAQSWLHFAHIITSDMDDANDIDRCRHKLIGQVNNVLCSFHQVDSVVKITLSKSYCLNLYGLSCGTSGIMLLEI